MRELLFIGCLFFGITCASWAQPILSVGGGYSSSSWSGDNIKGIRIRPGSGFTAGLGVEFPINEAISLTFQTSYLYEQGRILFRNDSTSQLDDSLRIKSRLVIFPVLLKVYSLKRKLYFTGGFVPGYEYASEVREKTGNEKLEISDFTNDFHLAFNFGIGYRFKALASYANLEWRYNQGMTNILDPDEGVDVLLRSKLVSTRLILFWEIPFHKFKRVAE